MLLTGGRSLTLETHPVVRTRVILSLISTANAPSGASAIRRKRHQVQTNTDRNAAAVRLVRATLNGAMMPLTKSDAFEKRKPIKFVFLLTDIMCSMGRWWKVPAKADSTLVISVAYSTPPFLGGGLAGHTCRCCVHWQVREK